MNTAPSSSINGTPDVGEDSVRSALEASQPFEWSDPEPLSQSYSVPAEYPLDALPVPIQDAAKEVARFAKVPAASPAVVGISVVATALGKSVVIEERPGLMHYPTLFHLIVAASGERKSPVFKHMQGPLAQWEIDREPEWKEAKQKAEAASVTSRKMIGMLEKKIKPGMTDSERDAIERQIAAEHGRMVAPPPAPRLSTSDITEERLFQLMHERGGAFAVMSGEGRPVVDAIVGRYSDGRTGDSIYLAGISGDDITRDRVGNERTGPESRVIHTPALNVCAMVQPDKLLEAVRHPSLRASGALARIWPVWLPSLVGSRIEARNEAGLNQLRLTPFYEQIRNLLHLRAENDGGPFHIVKLSPDAAEARREWHNAIEARMAAGGEFEDVRDIASKAVSSTVKLAGIIHLMKNPGVLAEETSEIDLETWADAATVGFYHLSEAVRILRLASADDGLSEASRVLEWLAKGWGNSHVSARDLVQKGPRPRPTKVPHALAILRTLAEHGYLMEERPSANSSAPRFALHPRIQNFVPRTS